MDILTNVDTSNHIVKTNLFYPELEDPYILQIESPGVLGYSLQQSGQPLLFLTLRNNTMETMTNLSITIQFEFNFIEPFKEKIEKLPPGQILEITPRLNIHAKELFNLSEMMKDHVYVAILDDNENCLVQESVELPVLPMNQWSGPKYYPESLATFVMPNIPQVHELLSRASQILNKTSNNAIMDGYQSGNKNHVRQQIAAIYGCIYEMNINYVEVPPTFFQLGQRVRTPQEVLKFKQGNCVEMAILFCSVAEAAGLHPFIVLMEGHAFAGAWLQEEFFMQNLVTDVSEIKKRLAHGINDLEVIECTCMNVGNTVTFEQAVQAARRQIDRESTFIEAIDIYRSHISGIRPMPITIVQDGEARIIDYGLADDAEDSAVSSVTIEEHFLNTDHKQDLSKREIWMRNLLDLGKRNPLISFRASQKSVQLFTSDLDSLEDALAAGEAFEIREIVERWEPSDSKIQFLDIEKSDFDEVSRITDTEFKSKRLRTFLSRKELDRRLKSLYREARNSLEETGSNTLYLATGFLRWYDPTDRKGPDGVSIPRYAPLVLLPIDLIRKTRGAYRLALRDEDPQLNLSIVEKLRQDFDLTISGLNPLPLDESGVDLKLVFNSVRKAIMKMSGWDVLELAFLGHFSFSQFVMWNDLRNSFDQLIDNKTVRALNDGLYTDYNDNTVKAEEIDTHLAVNDICIPSSVDSSQLAAIIEAAQGSSFVLHGPPGTGKSQTITNLIANALNQNKTILFVAEKMVALNVVKERLELIGLGDYTLELHSNKTNKRTVLEKLERNLKMNQRETNDEQFNYKASRIQKIKDSLNKEILDLHRIRQCNKSLYELINESLSYSDIPYVFAFPDELISKLNQEQWDEWNILSQQLDREISYLRYPVNKHPLKEFRSSDYSYKNQNDLTAALQKLTDSLKKLHIKYNQIIHSNSSDKPIDLLRLIGDQACFASIQSLCQLLFDRKMSVTMDNNSFNLLLDPDNQILFSSVQQSYKTHIESRAEVNKKYTSAIFNFDIINCKKAYLDASNAILFKRSKQKKALLDLNAMAHNSFRVTPEYAVYELDNLIKDREFEKSCKHNFQKIIDLLNLEIKAEIESSGQIADIHALSSTLNKLSTGYSIKNSDLYSFFCTALQLNNSFPEGAATFFSDIGKIVSLIDSISDLTGLRMSDIIPKNANLAEVCGKIQVWLDNINEWKSWSAFCSIDEILRKEGLAIFLDTYLSHASESEVNAHDIFNKNLISCLIRYYIEDSNNLSRFRGLEFENQIMQYNELIDEFEIVSQEQIRIKLSKNIPNPRQSSEEELKQAAALSRIIHSKGRGTSIRQLFESCNLIIKRLCPVLLMSPLSVAQYIDPSFPKFDLLIFDEASQIRTSVAVGAMSRAKDCIIVGDPKQMPPTSFFISNKIDEDNLDVEDLESVLDDALAVNMPQQYLDWHYRSQNESLINFSNATYYGGRMMTFPSPYDQISRLSFRNIHGEYDRGGSSTNRYEAEAIVDEIILRMRDPELRSDSIGIVTFNIKQQNLIDDLLQDELSKDSNLDYIVQNLEESIFIKNLESVQGDERDCILFSIGYGPDKDERMFMNFGPLNNKGGWRRLNVATSRARKEMIVFCSFEPEDLRITAKTPDGVLGLQNFLYFARDGYIRSDNLLVDNKDYSVDKLVQNISKLLIDKGYEVRINLGYSKLKIDLAVVHPDHKDTFLCALMIDGLRYAGLNTSRDRNRLVPNILNRMGWNIYSIWSMDWYENYERECDRLLSYLEKAQEISNLEFARPKKPSKLTSGQNNNSNLNIDLQAKIQKRSAASLVASINKPELDSSDAVQIQQANEGIKIQRLIYRFCPVTENYPSDALIANSARIVKIMRDIIDIEAPIHEELLFKRVTEFFSCARQGQNIREFMEICSKSVCRLVTSIDGNRVFWSDHCLPDNYYDYRVPRNLDERRDFSLIPIQELINALDYHLGADLFTFMNKTEADLKREVAREFGYSRLSKGIEEYLDQALKALKIRWDQSKTI